MAISSAELSDKIKALYDNPDEFVKVALSCNTAGVDAKIHDWFRKPPFGMFVTEMKFTEDYIASKTEECFVRAMLCDASMCEGRGRDIFKGVSLDKKESFLREKIMPEYITPKDLRLCVPDLSVFLKMFSEYGENNGIPLDKREKLFYKTLLSDLPECAISEIGGNNDDDHLYFAAKAGMVYIINFGQWK